MSLIRQLVGLDRDGVAGEPGSPAVAVRAEPRLLPAPPARRAFAAAMTGRLVADWVLSATTLDADLKVGLRGLRNRGRWLAQNNSYAAKFVALVDRNVVGQAGIRPRFAARRADDTLDTALNDRVAAAWADWGKLGQCTVCGGYSWRDVQGVVAKSLARDGEVLVRKVAGFPNRHGFALQLIEADLLDDQLNQDLGGGREIRLGIELDEWKRPVAYHLLSAHPGDVGHFATHLRRHQRVPADQVLHLFHRERVAQVRGFSKFAVVALRMKMLDGFEESAVIAARAGASKMGFYEESVEGALGVEGDETDAAGDPVESFEPGTFHRLPPGVKFSEFNPGYPDAAFGPFVKALLRSICSGLDVSYTSLASDLEGVNFSSIRAGVLDERDAWRQMQGWLIEHFVAPVFAAWLPMARLAGTLPLSNADMARVGEPLWRGRGWAWVDPLKDEQANALGFANGTKSRTRALAEQGVDFWDVLEELAEEQAFAAELGVPIGPTSARPTADAAAGSAEPDTGAADDPADDPADDAAPDQP